MKEAMGIACSALITVGTFVVFERTIKRIVNEIPWPYIPSIIYFLALGIFPGFVAAKIVQKEHGVWIAAVGTAIGAMFVLSILRQQMVLPFAVPREFSLLATVGVPALSGALMAKACTPKGK